MAVMSAMREPVAVELVGRKEKHANEVEHAATVDHDMELASRHVRGDPAAFEEVYRRTATRVFNLALRLSGDAEEAREASQDVFLRVFRHLGRYRGGATLETWVLRVTINCCRSRWARLRRRLLFAWLPWRTTAAKHLADDALAADPVDPRPGPEEQLLAGDARRQVLAALEQVALPFREALILRDLDGASYEDIAAVLQVPLGTVRSRIARGRDQLRRALATPHGGRPR